MNDHLSTNGRFMMGHVVIVEVLRFALWAVLFLWLLTSTNARLNNGVVDRKQIRDRLKKVERALDITTAERRDDGPGGN